MRFNSKYFYAVIGLSILFTPQTLLAKTLLVPAEHQTIQGAINAASAGDIVLVSPGTYNETLELKERVAVRSVGTEEEHLNHTAARRTIVDSQGIIKPVVEGADGAILDGFTLTGLGKINHHLPGHFHGVQCRGASPIIINNIVHDMGSTGIGSHNDKDKPSNPYIANNIVYNNHGLGIGSNNESAATIINNVVFNNTEVGIGIRNGAHSLIENNIVFSNGWAGIGVKNGGFPCIVGNKSYHNGTAKNPAQGAGIGVMATFVPIIEENETYENRLGGIGVRKGGTAVIRNNKTHHNRYSGIGLDGAVSVLIENNEIYENKRGGIGITNNSSAVIKNNSIHGNENAGIAPSGKQLVITEGNTLKDNGEPYSAAPPDMTMATEPVPAEIPRDESGGISQPLGLPDPAFFEWLKYKK